MATVQNHVPTDNHVRHNGAILITEPALAAWQRAFRVGIVSQLTTAGLEGLRKALEQDDPRLITGATTNPPPLHCVADWAVEGCCPLCFALLDGRKPYEVSVGPMEERFAQACWNAD